ncbi:MAG TPA: ABC transporter permease, partial [Flavisolibacter sp.]|nr:ABC transporter permease [Flavisolibacter sp.]
MLKNYLFIAWRNLARRKVYTTINISGLAIGIAACLLLFSIIKYELSYESFQPNRNRIYHVVTQDKTPNGLFFTPGIPYPALEAIRTDIPQVTTGCLYASYGSQVTVLGNKDPQSGIDKKFIEDNGFFFADPQFFQIFHVEWLSGSPGVLKEPNTTVLTQEVAEKYFGNWKSAVGQLLKLDNSITVKVAGVLKDLPLNTDFPLKVVNSFETLKANMETYGFSPEWGSTTSNFQIFLLLPNGSSEAEINRQLAVFSKRQYATRERSVRTNFLQPLSEVHFDSRFGNLGDHTISKSSLWTLALIGIFIIIMASINFINLSTAQAVGRSKEVGIRKVLGSNRKQLFWQVIGETGIIVFVAVLLAIGMAILCLPYLKHIASIQERLSIFNWPALGFIILVAILVTFGAGFYHSLVLSGFNPALALKNKITSASMGGISLRRGLVVLQFAISQVLIIGTIIAVSQMKFVQQADLGFNKEALMIISSNSDSIITAHQPAFKEKLLQIPGIQSVSFSSDVPSSDNNWATNFAYDHKDDETFSVYL